MSAAVVWKCCCALLLAGLAARGAETIELPRPLDPAFAAPLIQNPPFTRVVNPSESLQLTGVAYIQGKPVVTVRDTSTNQTHVVSEEPNALGWSLVGAFPATQTSLAEMQIRIAGETVTIRYSQTQMTPVKRSGGGGGYMPNRVPTTEEFTGRDDKGPYVRGMPYLKDEDRAKFGSVPRETRDRFLKIVHDERDRLFRASHEERAAFVKRAFDSVMPR